MITLGIIGTGAITHYFIEAAHKSGAYQLTAVYSRSLHTAQEFAKQYHNADIYTDLATFFASSISTVYIASPNSLHFQQAKMAIEAKKHVIIEKPAVSHPEEWVELVTLAQKHHVYLFEAARNYHEDAFTTISSFLKDKTILGAHFTYAKYSSKMPDLLKGEIPNVFSATFSGGALMDLGIYTVYAAVRLFGAPQKAHYLAQQLPNTVDLNGQGSLIYPDFQVHLQAGKNMNSFLPSEIYTTDGTLILDSIEAINSATFHPYQGATVALPIKKRSLKMEEQVAVFARIILEQEKETYQTLLEAAQAVHTSLFQMRQAAGIRFEVDHD